MKIGDRSVIVVHSREPDGTITWRAVAPNRGVNTIVDFGILPAEFDSRHAIEAAEVAIIDAGIATLTARTAAQLDAVTAALEGLANLAGHVLPGLTPKD